MLENLSPAELYAIELGNEEPGYYAQIPGILYYLTYIAIEVTEDGIHRKIRKKLSAEAIMLYGYMKQIASHKNNPIFMKAETIAETLRISLRKVYYLFQELETPCEQLNGKTLIEALRSKKTAQTAKGEKRVVVYKKHRINPIWPENNAYMSTLKYQLFLPLGVIEETSIAQSCTRSDIDCTDLQSMSQDRLHRSAQDPQAESECPNNKHSLNKKHSVTEQEAAGACDCNSDPIKEYQMQKQKCKTALYQVGADERFIDEMLSKYPPKQIMDAGYYVLMQKKRKVIGNDMGYLRKAIEKGLIWREDNVSKMHKRK